MNTLSIPTRSVQRGLAFVWLATAASSALTAHTLGPALLSVQVDIPHAWHAWLIWGGALVDLLLGLAMLQPSRPRVWSAAFWLVLAMTALATWIDPTLWLHPLGPLTKNIPILIVLRALMAHAPTPQGGAP